MGVVHVTINNTVSTNDIKLQKWWKLWSQMAYL